MGMKVISNKNYYADKEKLRHTLPFRASHLKDKKRVCSPDENITSEPSLTALN
jgi:hypothetical protein